MNRADVSRRVRRIAAAAALTATVAACGSLAEAPESLATTCQMRPCTCEEPNPTLFTSPETVPIVWSERGFASCPEGYVLRRAR